MDKKASNFGCLYVASFWCIWLQIIYRLFDDSFIPFPCIYALFLIFLMVFIVKQIRISKGIEILTIVIAFGFCILNSISIQGFNVVVSDSSKLFQTFLLLIFSLIFFLCSLAPDKD